MKYIKELALFSALSFVVMGADAALAKGKNSKKHAAPAAKELELPPAVPHAGEKPLMVVRFSEPGVQYEWPLYNTLTKALEAYPQGTFDVVSVAPRSTDLNQQLKDNEIATGDLTKVLGTLKEIGLPESRYSVTKIYDDVKASEIRFYIK